MNERKEKQFNPLAINILRLQNYSNFFDLPETALFEWFMIKASSFKKLDEFYYSIRRIAIETKIRKAQLATIINKFETLGIISVERKGMPKCSYFRINKNNVIALIPQIYKFSENGKLLPESGKLLPYFSKLLPESSKHKGTYQELNLEPISNLGKEMNMVVEYSTTLNSSSFSDEVKPLTPKEQKALETAKKKAQREAEERANFKKLKIERLTSLLNRVYENRVIEFNNGLKKGQRAKRIINLSFLKRNEDALFELGQKYDNVQIENSFIAYVDDFLEGEIKVGKLVSYFLARKPVTGDFDTFHTYLNKFIADYTHEKK